MDKVLLQNNPAVLPVEMLAEALRGIAAALTGSSPQPPSQLMSRLFELKKHCIFAKVFLVAELTGLSLFNCRWSLPD